MTIEERMLREVFDLIERDLPAELDALSLDPLRWRSGTGDGTPGEWTEQIVRLDAPAELWAEDRIRTRFPTLAVYLNDSEYQDESEECGSTTLSSAVVWVDIALAGPDDELLVWLWLRYAEAVRNVIARAPLTFRLSLRSQRVIESGPLESLHLRRGALEFSGRE